MRAGIVKQAEDYKWSSAQAHMYGLRDRLIMENIDVSGIENWREYLQDDNDEVNNKLLLKHINTGRPLGDDRFIDEAEKLVGKELRIKKPGPKKKQKELCV